MPVILLFFLIVAIRKNFLLKIAQTHGHVFFFLLSVGLDIVISTTVDIDIVNGESNS